VLTSNLMVYKVGSVLKPISQVLHIFAVTLVNDTTSLATLSLSTADVHILLHAGEMAISGKLNSLALSHDSKTLAVLPNFTHIMSIEGQDFAEFHYQTFNPNAETYTGIKSLVYLNVGSIKFHFLEHPLHDIYLFFVKLAKLKGLYDAATQVAIQSASEIERLQFDITIKSPILVFPSDPVRSQDALIMRLGEIRAKNTSEAVVNKIVASLRGIQLVSKLHYAETPSVLKIIDDIDITADIVQTSGINRSKDNEYPDTQVRFSSTRFTKSPTRVFF
jgi:vacuolar protein sorting-associated protein 13A/C